MESSVSQSVMQAGSVSCVEVTDKPLLLVGGGIGDVGTVQCHLEQQTETTQQTGPL